MESNLNAEEGVCCEYDWAEIFPSVAILKTIGVYKNTVYQHELNCLAEPLFRYFDPDALNKLIESGTRAIVSFRLDDFLVEVRENIITVKNHNFAAQ